MSHSLPILIIFLTQSAQFYSFHSLPGSPCLLHSLLMYNWHNLTVRQSIAWDIYILGPSSAFHTITFFLSYVLNSLLAYKYHMALHVLALVPKSGVPTILL